MDTALLNIFAFLRPILFIDVNYSILGFKFFDLAGVLLIYLIAAVLIKHMATARYIRFGVVDQLILLYVLWCVASAIAYPEHTSAKAFIKWVTPFLSYFVVKNVLLDARQYLSVIRLFLIGTTIPMLLSTALILSGHGVEFQDYWTKLNLYKGVYSGSHTFGHSMALFIMLGPIYYAVAKFGKFKHAPKIGKIAIAVFTILCFVALYNLVKAQLRNAMIGLVIFFGLYLFFYKRKWLLPALLAFIVVVVVSAPRLALIFYDFVQVEQGTKALDTAGSGRPIIWAHNLTEFSRLPLDRQLVGAGIGNQIGVFEHRPAGEDEFWPSHNDYLEVLVQSGIVGFGLFICLQIALVSRILRFPQRDKWAFLSFFLAVAFMNAASNSYITRFGLAQVFYLLLAYIELPFVPSREELEKPAAAVANTTDGRLPRIGKSQNTG